MRLSGPSNDVLLISKFTYIEVASTLKKPIRVLVELCLANVVKLCNSPIQFRSRSIDYIIILSSGLY